MQIKHTIFKPAIFVFFTILLLSYVKFVNAQDTACSKKWLISNIEITGNKTTKDQVITRELAFGTGDSVCNKILPGLISESKTNLEKTPLFNYVTFYTDTISDQEMHIRVKVEERWYFIPLFTVTYADRNLNNWLKNKDWTRIKVGGGFEKYNFRGRNENLGTYVLFGYDEQFSLYYKNIYFDDLRKFGSSIFLKYYKRKETPYQIINDQYAQLKLEGDHAINSYGIASEFFYRVKPNEQHTIGTAFENLTPIDSVRHLNPEYLPGNAKSSNYLYLRYIYSKDMRDSRIFPMSGYKIILFAQKTGLGFFPESNINFFHIRPQISNHFRFGKRFSLANQLVAQKSFGSDQPFFLQNGLGTEFNIRGYEYYVVQGQDFVLSNNSLNFELIPKTVFTLKFLPFPKFNKIHFSMYLGAFADAAYARNTSMLYMQNNQLANTLLYSGGLSVNLITYYDKLIRFDYSWNKLGERHFFFHITAPF